MACTFLSYVFINLHQGLFASSLNVDVNQIAMELDVDAFKMLCLAPLVQVLQRGM